MKNILHSNFLLSFSFWNGVIHLCGRDRAAMFVANHNSWMDIPFMGHAIGWRNYKFISKAELGQIPIIGRSIKNGGHVMIDRTNRRSQILTLKSGMQWLKVSITILTSKMKITYLYLNFLCKQNKNSN